MTVTFRIRTTYSKGGRRFSPNVSLGKCSNRLSQDAAAIDGCSRVGFFWRILIPNSRPAIMTVSILAFVTSWNAFLLPLIVLNNPNEWTLPLGVASYQTEYSQDTAAILAFTALGMIPALAFFLAAERRIVGGLSGAVKG